MDQEALPEEGVTAGLEPNDPGSEIICEIQGLKWGLATIIFCLFSEDVGSWDPSLSFLCPSVLCFSRKNEGRSD